MRAAFTIKHSIIDLTRACNTYNLHTPNAALKNDAIIILIENSRYFGIEYVFPNQMKDAIHQL